MGNVLTSLTLHCSTLISTIRHALPAFPRNFLVKMFLYAWMSVLVHIANGDVCMLFTEVCGRSGKQERVQWWGHPDRWVLGRPAHQPKDLSIKNEICLNTEFWNLHLTILTKDWSKKYFLQIFFVYFLY